MSQPTPTDANDERLAAEKAALENCETESIRDIGTIQPSGFLLATNPGGDTITHASENTAEMLGVQAAELVGTVPSKLVGTEVMHAARNAAGHRTIDVQREYLTTAAIGTNGNMFDVSMYSAKQKLILEFQPVDPSSANAAAMVIQAQRVVKVAGAADSVDELLTLVVDHLRHLSGFDRVKAYRFLPDGAGEVCAESRTPVVDSFLGLRFPAFDIPEAARQLYVSTPIRTITSVEAQQVPIAALQGQHEPLDLGLATLRGCVPVHTQYLQNMGVKATMSLPIVVHGQMWGLFAFHHYQPRTLGALTAMNCELIGQSLSVMIEHLVDRDHARLSEYQRNQATLVAAALRSTDDSEQSFATSWDGTNAELQRLVPCDGVALVGRVDLLTTGLCPAPNDIRLMLADLRSEGTKSREDRTPMATTDLAARFPQIEGLSGGALVLRRPAPSIEALLFFREPLARKIRWAGQTNKEIEQTADGLRLRPRASFAEYVESVEGRSDDWDEENIGMATALQEAFIRVNSLSDSQAADRERLGLMVRELNHRVRNILALVNSLIRQSKTDAVSVDEYVHSLSARVAALGGAHDLLTENQSQPVQIADLLSLALKPYGLADPDRIRLAGPAFTIDPDVAHVLVLVIHELASNAAKYGSLGSSTGRLDLTWTQLNAHVTIDWVESGGPPVEPNPGEGLGSSIIRNALAFEFNTTTTLQFDPGGVRAQLVVPASGDATPAETDQSEGSQAPEGLEFGALRVLLVEDDFMIAKETAASLVRVGVPEPTMVSTCRDAISLLEDDHGFDVALLDANLRGEFSGPVATRLAELGIPFVFVTGYGSQDQQLEAFDHLRVLTKPLSDHRLVAVLSQVTANRE